MVPGNINDTIQLPSGGGGFNPAADTGGYYGNNANGIGGGQNFTGNPNRPNAGVDIPPANMSRDPNNIQGGPFDNWTQQQFNYWHEGQGPNALGYPTFEGTTAGPGGDPLQFNTNSVNVPGVGWVPMAQLNDPQASNFTPTMSDQDMINQLGFDPGDPRNNLTTGFGSGRPTQKGVGTVTNIAGNMVFPGLGMVTGPAGSWITKMIQNWLGQRNVNNALNPQGGGGGGGGTSTSGGSGFDFGKFFGDPGYSDPAYLRSIGYQPGQGTGSLWPAEHGYIPGGRFSPLAGSFAGLGSFSGAAPLTGPWGGINSPVGRAALAGRIIDPGRMPDPGFAWNPNVKISAPGTPNIVNPAAFGQASSANQSIHFRPRAND